MIPLKSSSQIVSNGSPPLFKSARAIMLPCSCQSQITLFIFVFRYDGAIRLVFIKWVISTVKRFCIPPSNETISQGRIYLILFPLRKPDCFFGDKRLKIFSILALSSRPGILLQTTRIYFDVSSDISPIPTVRSLTVRSLAGC